jgi:hypothetical protein
MENPYLKNSCVLEAASADRLLFAVTSKQLGVFHLEQVGIS